MSSWSNGGRDEDGQIADAFFECEDCGLYLSWPITEGLPPSEDPKQAEMRAMVEAHGWDDCGRSEVSLAPAVTALPRGFYFSAEDWAGKMYQDFEGSRRQKILQAAITNADHLVAALKTARQFDRLGNIDHVLPQITAALADVVARTNEFVSAVQRTTDEYRKFVDRHARVDGGQPIESAAALDTSDVPAAAASTPDEGGDNIAHLEWTGPSLAPMPKPGPHLASVSFDRNVSQRDQLAALGRRVEQRWGGRR